MATTTLSLTTTITCEDDEETFGEDKATVVVMVARAQNLGMQGIYDTGVIVGPSVGVRSDDPENPVDLEPAH